jgi:hypothetical protein
VTEQETVTHCFMCGHPVESHDLDPDGNRPCRSPGHPKGVPCADCRALLTPEYRARIQDQREEDGFEAAWNSYYVTLQDARDHFGEHAPVFFSDIHQSALASALIAYREQQKTAEQQLQAITEAVVLWRDRPGGDVGLAIALAGILDTEQPEPPAATALVRVLRECDRIERAVHDNPTSPDLAGGYLACLRHIREAASGEQEATE